MKERLRLLADLLDSPDGEVAEREAVLALSVLVDAVSFARAWMTPNSRKRF